MSVFSEETDVAVNRIINGITSFATAFFSGKTKLNTFCVGHLPLCQLSLIQSKQVCCVYIYLFVFKFYLWSLDHHLIIWVFLFFFFFSDFWWIAVHAAVVRTMISNEHDFIKRQKRPVILNINTFRQLAFTCFWSSQKHAWLLTFSRFFLPFF